MNEHSSAPPALSAPRKLWRLISRILLGLLAALAALLVVGFIFDAVAARSDWQRYPPPGILVDVGGFRLHLYCTGEAVAGRPTVVLEAGSGSASPDWGLVQPEVAKTARVCSYDRAGYAWSDPGPRPRTSQQFTNELHTLLSNAGEPGPYILVSHSLGGHTVRMYAHQYPENVAGMVLVDARLEDESSNPLFASSRTGANLMFWEFMARLGFFRFAGRYAWPPVFFAKMPDYPIRIIARPGFFATSRAEDAIASDYQVQAVGDLGDTALTVISHAVPDMFTHLPPDQAGEAETAWQAGQHRLAALSTHSRFVLAEGSGHFIPIERPDLVIDAIQQILQAAN